jgi:hypothetical protein
MIPWQQIDAATVPGADVELRLMRRGAEFSMMLGSNELMNSRLSGSEEALATLACRQIETIKAPHLLIGGLGMGFTLRAALAVLGSEARITVAELVPAVIAWARGPLAGIFGDSLRDPRADIRSADVVDVIRSHAAAFDAILLDVDNGAESCIFQAASRRRFRRQRGCVARDRKAQRRPPCDLVCNKVRDRKLAPYGWRFRRRNPTASAIDWARTAASNPIQYPGALFMHAPNKSGSNGFA